MKIFNFFKKSVTKDPTVILQAIDSASTLGELLVLHRKAWREGYQNRNLAPCSYGMFRTEDINKMTIDEVYLGNICGLFTHPISFWEQKADEEEYDILLNQYKNLLISNIKTFK